MSLPVWLVLACGDAEPEAKPCGPGAYPDRDQCFCDPGHSGDPDVGCEPHDDLCAEAEARLGHSVCVHELDDEAKWTELSIGGGFAISGLRRLGKHMVPATPTARLPTVYTNANYYRLHYCFMAVAFGPLFPGLTKADYAELILSESSREYWAGAIYEFQHPDPYRFAFSVETAKRPDAQATMDEIFGVYRTLADRFGLGDLAYVPWDQMQRDAMAGWVDPPFPIATLEGDGVGFEAYTPGIAYGRVRMFEEDADYSWQDIVVFDQVPFAFEGVVAASVTGERQDILSHLNVLAAQRGTPNFFVDDAVDVFAQFDGQLVRVETAATSYKLVPATLEEAEAHWAAARPKVEVENPAQVDYAELDAFSTIPTTTAEERSEARSRFGAKTVGLATLASRIPARYQTPGLGVPFHYYDAFMRDNTWEPEPGVTQSYAETVEAWLADDEFRGNASVRKARLQALRFEIEYNGVVDPELVQLLHDRIVDEFGSDAEMVRLRSSSNAEDTPNFNGAGLYDSTSACAADSLQPGTVSACDPGKDHSPLDAGLKRVWASLWNYGAFEERDFYQMDHRRIAMGATVSRRYENELANGVAFTGDPLDPTRPRYTINAQAGERNVVDPTPGVTAELTYLEVADGKVTSIDRAVPSSLAELVLTDAKLFELGELMATLAETYPVDHDEPVLLDLEFKVTSEDQLVIKQIRTFLPTPFSADPNCRE